MATTKRELVKRIAKMTNNKQEVTKEIIQAFLDQIIEELAAGHRLEFREFGVFDIVHKKPRVARNPRTGETVHVPAKRMVHFKVGRLMKKRVMGESENATTNQGSAPAAQSQPAATPSTLPPAPSPTPPSPPPSAPPAPGTPPDTSSAT